jgi:N-succinyldiaminopimelate aminotransferase
MNPDIEKLQPYPFQRLTALFKGIEPNTELKHIALSIGEPKHQAPQFIAETLNQNMHHLGSYPGTAGLPELRQCISRWATRRFHLKKLNADSEILPVNGTREAIFSLPQTIIDRSSSPLVLSPNPFYQIYEGASYLAGAAPYYLNCSEENQFIPNFSAVPAQIWKRCQLVFLCSPGNPSGAVIPAKRLAELIDLSDHYNFVIASDECYSEIYLDESIPPPGLLQVCAQLGRDDYRNCMVFHSLSKRSNLPGLRSGFVAGDSAVIRKFLQYRTYHGCAMPLQNQMASIKAWSDEQHVVENRTLYREKFAAILDILNGSLDMKIPDAGFYLWPKTPISGSEFAKGLFQTENITVLPGEFLGREAHDLNPGYDRVRIALVAPIEQCIEAAHRIRRYCKSLN